MPQVLNVDNAISNQVQDFQIEGESFFIHTYFNPRNGWTVDVQDKFKTPLLSGLLLVPNGNLTFRYSKENIFKGDLWCIDNDPSEDFVPLDRDNFGNDLRYSLEYLTVDEMDELDINPRT